MFTRTSKVLILALAGILGGCSALSDTGTTGVASLLQASSRATVEQSALLRGLQVRGPTGTCIDQATLKASPAPGFALIGDCSGLNAGRAFARLPAVMTVTATRSKDFPTTRETRRALADELEADTGRSVLSRRGDAEDVVVHQSKISDVAIYFEVSDKGVTGGLSKRHWKALFSVNGYLVTLSHYGTRARLYNSADGEAAIRSLAASVLGANSAEELTAPI